MSLIPLRETVSDHELYELRLDATKDLFLQLEDSWDSANAYQREVLGSLALNGSSGVIDLPTRSGKSHLVREIAAEASSQGLRTVILAPKRHIIDEYETELRQNGTETTALFENGLVQIGSVQQIARIDTDVTHEEIDLVLVDEGHKALGSKTMENISRLYSNAVVKAFSASPDYAEDKSMTDFFGEKAISKKITEAIESGYVSSLRTLVYLSNGEIDNLDPSFKDFTSRELRRLIEFEARNQAGVDMVTDLVTSGRQGLVATMPGENLLHADIIKERITSTKIVDENGTERLMRAEVVKGSAKDVRDILDDFEAGYYDTLVFCDRITEGYTSDVASFLVNLRPTTSIVRLTQLLGRILQPKDVDAVFIDFIDKTIGKRQKTIYDVVELDRTTQGFRLGPPSNKEDGDSRANSDTFLRGIFRPHLFDAFEQLDNELVADLTYPKGVSISSFDKIREKKEKNRQKEIEIESRKWNKLLKVEASLPAIDQIDDEYMHTPGHYKYLGDDDMDNLPLIDEVPFSELTDEELAGIENIDTAVDIAENVVQSPEFIREALTIAMMDLRENEKIILDEIYGISSGKGLTTLSEAGRKINVSRERARQIEAKALAKLRHPHRSGILVSYLPKVQEESTESLLKALDIKRRYLGLQSLDLSTKEIFPTTTNTDRDEFIRTTERLFSKYDHLMYGVSTHFFYRVARLVAIDSDTPIDYKNLTDIVKDIAMDIREIDLLEIIDKYKSKQHFTRDVLHISDSVDVATKYLEKRKERNI